MIPKLIHFIWIGKKPNYLSCVLDAYKNKNINCTINLISYTIIQLENIFFKKHIKTELDNIIFQLLYDILYKKRYQELIKCLLSGNYLINHKNTAFIQIFCDILRLEILNIYGGIYIDCDTYPIKQFDNFIFEKDLLCVYDKIDNLLIPNNYFLASSKKYQFDNYFDITNNNVFKLIHTNNQQFIRIYKNKDFDFMIRRIKFFKNKLTDRDFTHINHLDYFEHYSEFRWGMNKIPKTQFDNIFFNNYKLHLVKTY